MVNYLEFSGDSSLPFFVYDIFNPNFSQLDQIDDIKSMDIDNMVEKIVPTKIKRYHGNNKQGYLIYFKEDCCDKAYDIISKSNSPRYSQWKEKEVNDKRVNVIVDKNNRNYENNFLELPDISLKFFDYGVFKKGQIAYSRIKNYIKEEKEIEIDYGMGIRDGIPILIENKKHKKTKGYLIEFNEKNRKKAYEIISNTKAKKLYKWKTIKIDGELTNVVIGNYADKGISDMEYTKCYDGKKDPYFSSVLMLIEKQIKKHKKNSQENFFILQMNYLLLWAAIERFAILKYGLHKPHINRQHFAGEETFGDYLENIRRKNDVIFSAKDFEEHILDKDNPDESIEYYYTIRCNVAHRGKIPTVVDNRSFYLLFDSLTELLYIFKEVLKDSFEDEFMFDAD